MSAVVGGELMIKHTTRKEASELLDRIVAYWMERGYVVSGLVIEAGYSPRLRSTVYEIKTDLVNGVPSRKAA